MRGRPRAGLNSDDGAVGFVRTPEYVEGCRRGAELRELDALGVAPERPIGIVRVGAFVEEPFYLREHEVALLRGLSKQLD